MPRPTDIGLNETSARPAGRVLAGPQFWALMEKWRVPDPVALDLIGYSGRKPGTGKRPRFRLDAGQQRMTGYLAAMDDALQAAGHEPAWLHRKGAPFGDLSPIDVMIQGGVDGAAQVLLVLNKAVLMKALAS